MTRKHSIVSVSLAALLAACGGSGSSDRTPPATAATRALRGTIATRAGTGTATTITVNGVAFAVDDKTVVRVEKVQKTEAELHHGMVVKVKGTVDDATRTGKASEVEFEDDVKGRSADDVPAGRGTVVVGGRTVHIEDSTRVMDDKGVDIAPSTLKKDDRLRVSGFADDQGRFRATSVERIAAASTDDSFEAKGFVTAIATDRTSFDVSLTPGGPLAYRVTLASGTLAAAIGVGTFVEVHGAGPAVGTSVTASSVTAEDHGLGGANAEVEVEGIVTSGSSGSFVVGGQTVITTAATRWEFGAAGDLGPGVKVEAEGHLDAANPTQLVADKVSFRDSLRLQGATLGALPGGNGTTVVLGKVVLISDLTRKDNVYQEGAVFEIRGMPASNTPGVDMIATRITLTSSGGGGARPFVQAVVTAASAATEHLTVFGIDVSTAGATYQNHNQADAVPSIGRDAFYAQVAVGRTVVKAKFNTGYTGGPGTAREVELQDEASGHH